MLAPDSLPNPLGLLAELTHRCPLGCPYCSNPLELERASGELTTAEWKKILTELAEIGVLQIHFSGGEPTARRCCQFNANWSPKLARIASGAGV